MSTNKNTLERISYTFCEFGDEEKEHIYYGYDVKGECINFESRFFCTSLEDIHEEES